MRRRALTSKAGGGGPPATPARGLGAPTWRLLRSELVHELRATAAVVSVLLVAVLLRLAMPVLLGRFVDDAVSRRPLDALSAISAVYVAAALGAAGLELVVTWGAVNLSWRVGNRLRERLAAHVIGLDMAWHGRHSPGQVIERVDGDVSALVGFFAQVLVNVLGSVVLVAGMLVVAFLIDWRAGMVLAATAGAATAVMVRMRVAAVPAREAEREASSLLYGDLEERLHGLEDLRANGAGAFAVHRLHLNSARAWRAVRRAALRGDGAHAIAAMVVGVGSVATLALGVVLHDRGAMTVGAIVSLFRFSEMLRQPLERVAEQLKDFQTTAAGARRAAGLLDVRPRIAEPAVAATTELQPTGALSIELERVTFGYDDSGPAVLHGVDLAAAAEEHVGIVGPTGSGKTTIARLLLRLWDVDEGAVRLGGVDVRRLPAATLRRRVAVVTQAVELFRAPLRDNLTLYGALAAPDAALLDVLDMVGLGPWLASLPGGLDAELGGVDHLSAGEAQLLAFARAFLVDPGVVILDEASSRLDSATEARVAGATRALLHGRTALIVAHRISTLDRVDQIVVLERGRVVESGPRALLHADGASRYAQLRRCSVDGLVGDGLAG